MNRRKIKILVLSDIHLGTRGSEARALLNYLQSIEPEMIILNGDIIDIWQFNKGYFPAAHWAVIKEFLNFAEKGIPVHYLTGNHDDSLRKITPFKIGNIFLDNKLLFELDGKQVWVFHGDIYDGSITHGKFAAKIAGRMYDSLIVFNRFVNRILRLFNCKPTHFSKKLKSGVKKAVQKVSNFETRAFEFAEKMGYDYVICGHIHKPQIREIPTENGFITYLNSGDWMENLTSLEYNNGGWEIFRYSGELFQNENEKINLNVNLTDLINSIENNKLHTVNHLLQNIQP